jgi:hypothetical protein
LKAVCKRTFFKEKDLLFEKNKSYDVLEYDNFFITLKTNNNYYEIWTLSKTNFIKHFWTFEEIRDKKLNEILK